MQDTLIPPTREQTVMYGSIVLVPHLGATQKTMTSEMMNMRLIQTRNPGPMKKCSNSLIVRTVCSFGALSAKMIDPRMHKIQPSHPWS